jgi:hypothetical protein
MMIRAPVGDVTEHRSFLVAGSCGANGTHQPDHLYLEAVPVEQGVILLCH